MSIIFLIKYNNVMSGNNNLEVINMSYVSPAIQEKFDTLSPELKSYILERDVTLYTMQDLINELELIVSEAEEEEG